MDRKQDEITQLARDLNDWFYSDQGLSDAKKNLLGLSATVLMELLSSIAAKDAEITRLQNALRNSIAGLRCAAEALDGEGLIDAPEACNALANELEKVSSAAPSAPARDKPTTPDHFAGELEQFFYTKDHINYVMLQCESNNSKSRGERNTILLGITDDLATRFAMVRLIKLNEHVGNAPIKISPANTLLKLEGDSLLGEILRDEPKHDAFISNGSVVAELVTSGKSFDQIKRVLIDKVIDDASGCATPNLGGTSSANDRSSCLAILEYRLRSHYDSTKILPLRVTELFVKEACAQGVLHSGLYHLPGNMVPARESKQNSNIPDVKVAQHHLQRLFDSCGDGSGTIDATWVMVVVTKAMEALSEGIRSAAAAELVQQQQPAPLDAFYALADAKTNKLFVDSTRELYRYKSAEAARMVPRGENVKVVRVVVGEATKDESGLES